jgi:hypothetical protein
MDAESYAIKSELRVEFVKPILTVKTFLSAKKGLEMLLDPLLTQVGLLSLYEWQAIRRKWLTH